MDLKIRNNRTALKIFLIMIISMVLVIGCSNENEKNNVESRIPVSLFKVQRSNVSIPVKSSGKISTEKEMRLSFKTGGIIEKIFAEEGSYVRKGDKLAELDLKEINAQVIQANSGYKKAQRDFVRIKALYQDSVVTLEQFQNMKTALEVAEANLEIANFNKNLSVISAPTSGQIYAKFAESGEIVGPGTPIFLFGSSGRNWEIEVGLTDKDIKKIGIGDSATATIDALQNQNFSAQVTEIAGTLDALSSTYKVKLKIKESDDKIMSGMVASVLIFPETSGMYDLIPIKSLANADNMTGDVYTLNPSDSSVQRISIKVKEIWDEMIIVERGLEEVDAVIFDGVEYMFEGAKVKVTNRSNSGDIK